MSQIVFQNARLAVRNPLFPHLTRSLQAVRAVPLPKEPISTPSDFLKAIGRSSETKLSLDSWEALWRMRGHDMKKAGLSVRDRKYILWCMEKYRNGMNIEEIAHEPKPKKTIRGWGPKVVEGKRIRSRRHR